jgi:hypothetical protein
MGTDVERVERYLRGIAVPSYASERHRQQLRRRILGEIGKKRTILIPGWVWRIAIAGVLLVCLGGVAGTLLDMRYRTADRQAGGVKPLVSEDVQDGYVRSTPISYVDGVANRVQTAQESEKTNLPPEQDDIEVVMVGANNHSPVSTSDHPSSPASLSPADWVELSQLRQAGKGEDLGTQERQLKGHTFVFQRERYTLRNRTRVIVSVGTPKDAQP